MPRCRNTEMQKCRNAEMYKCILCKGINGLLNLLGKGLCVYVERSLHMELWFKAPFETMGVRYIYIYIYKYIFHIYNMIYIYIYLIYLYMPQLGSEPPRRTCPCHYVWQTNQLCNCPGKFDSYACGCEIPDASCVKRARGYCAMLFLVVSMYCAACIASHACFQMTHIRSSSMASDVVCIHIPLVHAVVQ